MNDESSERERAVPLDEALSALRSAAPLDSRTLRAFNDPDEKKLAALTSVWDALDANRRAYAAEKLQMLLEQDFEVDFSPLFLHALRDADARVRLSAIEGLEHSDDLRLIDPLIGLLRGDAVEDVRALAAESLGRFMLMGELDKISQRRRDQVYSALMQTLLTEPESSPVYARALESLAFVSNEEIEYRIRAAYASEDEDLRVSAIAAMGRSADPAYEDIVRAELKSENGDMRAEAALAAGELEMADAVPILGKMIDDPMPFVAVSAVTALGMIGTKPARAHLERALKSDDEDVVAAAEEALDSSDLITGDIDFSGARFG